MKRAKSNRQTHIFSSRDKGLGRFFIMLAILLFILFAVCSVYAIFMVPDNPAAWSMAAFFLIGLILLVFNEENVFPNLPHKKRPYAVVTWFFAWIFVAFLAAFLITMNLSYLGLAVIFGVIVGLGGGFVVLSEARWTKAKTTVKSKTGGAIKRKVKKTKTGKKISKRMTKRKKRKEAKKKQRRFQYW